MSSQEEHRPEEQPCPPSPKPSAVVTPATHVTKTNAGSSSSSVKRKPPAKEKERGSGNPAKPYSDPNASTVADSNAEKKVKADLAEKKKKRDQQSFEDSIAGICDHMDRPLVDNIRVLASKYFYDNKDILNVCLAFQAQGVIDECDFETLLTKDHASFALSDFDDKAM
eukprot:7811512-Karenia_brevis.AAC.1